MLKYWRIQAHSSYLCEVVQLQNNFTGGSTITTWPSLFSCTSKRAFFFDQGAVFFLLIFRNLSRHSLRGGNHARGIKVGKRMGTLFSVHAYKNCTAYHPCLSCTRVIFYGVIGFFGNSLRVSSSMTGEVLEYGLLF